MALQSPRRRRPVHRRGPVRAASRREIFDQDDKGLVILLDATPPPALHEAARKAAKLCPARAITIEEAIVVTVKARRVAARASRRRGAQAEEGGRAAGRRDPGLHRRPRPARPGRVLRPSGRCSPTPGAHAERCAKRCASSKAAASSKSGRARQAARSCASRNPADLGAAITAVLLLEGASMLDVLAAREDMEVAALRARRTAHRSAASCGDAGFGRSPARAHRRPRALPASRRDAFTRSSTKRRKARCCGSSTKRCAPRRCRRRATFR